MNTSGSTNSTGNTSETPTPTHAPMTVPRIQENQNATPLPKYYQCVRAFSCSRKRGVESA